ncbi:MAG: hypothetical protein AAF525_01610 [Pseudomonadota bacterium]
MTWYPKWPIEIRALASDLYVIEATNPDAKPVRGTLNPGTRYSYFRTHRSGNVLFHGPDFKRFYKDQRSFFDDLGGIDHHVLTHGPEGSINHTILTEFWGTRHWLPAADVPYQPSKMSVIDFEEVPTQGRWLPGIRAVPLPGHTPGFTGYVVKSGKKTWLLSGDFICMGALASKPWHAPVRHPLLIDFGLKSLETLGRMKLDGLLPNKGFQSRSVPWSGEFRPVILEVSRKDILKRQKRIG